MHKICRVNIERSEEIFKGIEKYCREVIAKLKPKYIFLYGSFAKQDFNEASDVDLVVVADFKERFLDRIKTLLELNRFRIPLEPIGYTIEEFEKLKKERNPFVLEVLNGKLLYSR